MMILVSSNVIYGATPAQISLDHPEHDFGKFNMRDDIEHTFVVTNIGEQPLVITNVATSCSCLKASISKRPLRGGESRTMKVKYDAHKMPVGPFERTIEISSNSKIRQVYIIKLIGRSCYIPRKEQ